MRLVAVAGYSGEPPSELAKACTRFVDLLAERCGRGVALLLGGYWGVMRIVADRAIQRGLTVVIMSPLEREDTEFPEECIVIRTGASYRLRSVFLARACDVLVALGGASGTMQEIITAYCEGKPVLVLKSGLDTDRLEPLAPYIDRRALTRVEFFLTPEGLVDRLVEILGCGES